jgi:hypothetical protein
MDSLSATTITILGNYVLDAGVTLAREVGPAARETAEKLFTTILQHLRQRPESCLFDMGLAHDDLPGETRSQLAQSLVATCYHQNRLSELRRRCQQAHPHGDWS